MASLSFFSYRLSLASSSRGSPSNPTKTHNSLPRSKNPSFICSSSKKKTSFTDQILDYIEGGPKLRKWYGAPDLLPKDGSLAEEEDEREEEEIRDAIFVTNGDSEIGQLVILLLIVKRARVRALVKDKRAALDGFGTYVEVISGDTSDRLFLNKALKGVRAIICPCNEGFLSDIGNMKGLEHIVLLSQLAVYKGSSGIQALMYNKAKALAERDEATVLASGIPHTIIRAGLLQTSPGGKQGFSFKEGVAAKGNLSKEDAAFICVEALETVPKTGLAFEVVNGGEKVLDWKECFASLMEKQNLQ